MNIENIRVVDQIVFNGYFEEGLGSRAILTVYMPDCPNADSYTIDNYKYEISFVDTKGEIQFTQLPSQHGSIINGTDISILISTLIQTLEILHMKSRISYEDYSESLKHLTAALKLSKTRTLAMSRYFQNSKLKNKVRKIN